MTVFFMQCCLRAWRLHAYNSCFWPCESYQNIMYCMFKKKTKKKQILLLFFKLRNTNSWRDWCLMELSTKLWSKTHLYWKRLSLFDSFFFHTWSWNHHMSVIIQLIVESSRSILLAYPISFFFPSLPLIF